MKKLSITQDVVIILVLALWVVAGVPRLSSAQPAEPTMTAPNPDAKGQPHSNESERVQPRADQNKVGSDAAIAVEIQRRFNELESERLNDRADSINWWLNVVLIVLGFMAVVIPIVGIVSWRVAWAQFRQIETEAQKNVITSKQHADEARSLVKEIKAKRDEAESLVGKINAEIVGKDPDKAREAAEIHQTIAAAVLLQQEGKIDEAIDKWHSIASIAEGLDKELGAQAWFSIGYLFGEKPDHEAAIDAYTRALRLNPKYAGAYINLGNAKGALGQHQAALADYDAALRLNPNFAAAYYNRGNAERALGQYQAALTDYDKALRLNPNDAEAYINLGNAKDALGQHQAALADYDAALRLNPNLAAAYNNRGNTKRGLGQHQAALADYDDALRLNPDDAAAYYNRGLANRELDQVEEARQDFEKALALLQKAGNETLATEAKSSLQNLDKPKDS